MAVIWKGRRAKPQTEDDLDTYTGEITCTVSTFPDAERAVDLNSSSELMSEPSRDMPEGCPVYVYDVGVSRRTHDRYHAVPKAQLLLHDPS